MTTSSSTLSSTLSPQLYDVIFKKRRNVLIHGAGGCGKSFCLALIKELAIREGKIIHLTSTTGLSALAINGTTIHKFSGIKIGEDPLDIIIRDICYKNKDCLDRWKTTDLLVIDEVSMLGKKTITLVDQVGRNLRKNNKPFGGIQIILTGDFSQLPPVNDSFCFQSETIVQLNLYPVCFNIPYRYPDVRHFELLGRARKGELNDEDIKLLESRVKCYQDYLSKQKFSNSKERQEGEISIEDIKPTRIYSRKDDVDRENLIELNKLSGSNARYTCHDQFFKGKKKDSKKKEIETEPPIDDKEAYGEYLDNIVKKYVLFNVGAQVMLTVNLDQDGGLVNGSRGVVISCLAEGVKVLFLNGSEVLIGLHTFTYNDKKYKVIRHQIPLILAWSCTIHKLQGSTLDYAIISLGTSIFQAGQGYVALSRVRTLQGLFLIDFIADKIYADPKALEYEEKLLAIEKGNMEKEKLEEKKDAREAKEEQKEDENEPGSMDEKMTELSLLSLSLSSLSSRSFLSSPGKSLDMEGNRSYEDDELVNEMLKDPYLMPDNSDSD
jgi:ATP-dependent DNA helicase PIF1